MGKLIAVQGCTIKYSIDGGTVSVVSTVVPASSKVSSGGKKAYTDKITINVVVGTSVVLTAPPSGAVSGTSIVLTTPGTITISGSTQKAKGENKAFVCKGDKGDASFTFTFPGPNGSTVPSSVKITAEVADAGQNVINAT